ncbi:hypothetical protein WB401_39880 [Streptomyces brasiliscabiei]|uniref:Restriction endonuclease type IV Mrr domain-containing protein n=1 Tax=Streptomyces brasiliscabiei TaxID=2736302 RepID=A0ABU8GDW2_9ACTN
MPRPRGIEALDDWICTYSTFSHEAMRLMKGAKFFAALNVTASLGAVYIDMSVAEALVGLRAPHHAAP